MDYSAFRVEQDVEALKIYTIPKYQKTFNSYDKVLVEPVGIWNGKNTDMAGIPAEERQKLLNHLHGSLVNEVKQCYRKRTLQLV